MLGLFKIVGTYFQFPFVKRTFHLDELEQPLIHFNKFVSMNLKRQFQVVFYVYLKKSLNLVSRKFDTFPL